MPCCVYRGQETITVTVAKEDRYMPCYVYRGQETIIFIVAKEDRCIPCYVYREQGTITVIVAKEDRYIPCYVYRGRGVWQFHHGGGDSGHGLHKHVRGTQSTVRPTPPGLSDELHEFHSTGVS